MGCCWMNGGCQAAAGIFTSFAAAGQGTESTIHTERVEYDSSTQENGEECVVVDHPSELGLQFTSSIPHHL